MMAETIFKLSIIFDCTGWCFFISTEVRVVIWAYLTFQALQHSLFLCQPEDLFLQPEAAQLLVVAPSARALHLESAYMSVHTQLALFQSWCHEHKSLHFHQEGWLSYVQQLPPPQGEHTHWGHESSTDHQVVLRPLSMYITGLENYFKLLKRTQLKLPYTDTIGPEHRCFLKGGVFL